MTTFLAMVLVGAGSYLFRALPLLVLPRLTVSPRVDAALRDGGTAAVTALIVSALVHGGGGVDLAATVAAVATALVLAARGWTLLPLVATGLAVYAGVGLALGGTGWL